MSGVIALVLLAAVLHASWNAMLRANGDRVQALAVMCVAAAFGALPAVLWLPAPPASTWPMLGLSTVLHLGYNLCLLRSYRHGGLGQVYPIARGSAPLLVTLAAAVVVGERPMPMAMAGIVLVSAGIISLAWGRGRADRASILAALATGGFIAAYTVADGLGARQSGDAISYAAWLFLLDALPMVLVCRRVQGRFDFDLRRPAVRRAALGGLISLAGYGVVIWAVTLAPMGSVSALRETSVVFAALFGRLFLNEPLGLARLSACAAIAGGAAVLGYQAG